MLYTVAYPDAGVKRQEFDAYVRLLEERGIDWTNAPRVEAPGAPNGWRYVWDDRGEAEEFCRELQRETRDNKWLVRELSPGTPTSPGPLLRVVIFRRVNSLGAEFTLHPFSRRLVDRRFPEALPATTITIESSTIRELEQRPRAIWQHLALMLTHLTIPELAELGGFRIVDPATDQTIFEEDFE